MENVEMDWGRAAPTPRQLAQRCIAVSLEASDEKERYISHESYAMN